MPEIEIYQCSICGYETNEDEHELYDGEIVCNYCENKYYIICDECGESVHQDNITDVDGSELCEGCVGNYTSVCDECGILTHDRNLCYTGWSNVCNTCFDNYGECCWCGNLEHIDDLYDGYCENCEGDHDDWIFYKELDDVNHPIYFGIELEAGSMDRNIDAWRDFEYNSRYFHKHDDNSIYSSEVDSAVEIVSNPMTYKWLKNHKEVWNNILEYRKRGLRSYKTNTCGIHIHLTKQPFDEQHLYKFMKMVYGFPSFTKLISQRRESRLKEWASIEGETNASMRRKAKDRNCGMRYTAVNLTNHRTIEVRLFRGTLNPLSFWKNIEYVQSLIEFTKSAKVSDLSLKNYLKYVVSNKEEFSSLYKWLKKEKIKE